MKKTLLFLLSLLCMPLLTSCASAEVEQDGAMTLLAVNVGKADCMLLQYGGLTYMIDTGTAESWGRVSAALKMLEIDRLDGVILTHTHHDHAGGAWALATSSIEVGAWYAPAYYTGVKEKKHPAVVAAQLRDGEVQWLRSGDALPFGDGSLTVLAPNAASEKENCNSLVLLAEAAGGSILLMGDMEFPEEEPLLKAGKIPVCTVLKVANHGERDATSDALVYTVKPQLAVISTNSVEEPDTPSNRVMKALYKVNAQVEQTQTTPNGVRVSIRGGIADAEAVSFTYPGESKQVVISGKSVQEQMIRLRNEGASAADVSGWYLFSERGSEMLVLPEGTVLAGGETLTVSCLSSDRQGDVVWPEDKVLHKSKADAIVLYDVYGREASRME